MATVKLTKTYPRSVNLGQRSFRLHRLQPSDKDKVLAFARSLPEDDLLFLRMDITQPEVVDEWIASQDGDRRFTVLAEANGTLVGYGSINRQPSSWTRHLGEIRVIVAADERKSGLGSLLASEVFTVARDLELTKIVAQMAREQEGARRLFERLGFTAEALLTDWVIDRSGKPHDLIVMSHDVTALTT